MFVRLIAVIGNCQANAMVHRLRRAFAFSEDIAVEWVPSFREITPAIRDKVARAWQVCFQLGDFKNRRVDQALFDARPVILFPVLALHALWPASSRPHPRDQRTEHFRLGVFPSQQYCDDKANRIILKDLASQDAYEEYMSLDFSREFRLDRLFEMNQVKLVNLGAATGIPVWDMYRDQFRTRRLHHTNMHPSNFVLDWMAEQLIDRLRVPALSKMDWQLDQESLSQSLVLVRPEGGRVESINQMPIHPDVVRFYDLTWYDDRNAFHFEGDLTFSQYMWRYFSMEVNRELQAGMRHVSCAELGQGLDGLTKGLGISPAAHRAWFVMGVVLWRLERWAEAANALEQASILRTDCPTYRGTLARVRAREAFPWGARIGEVIFACEGVEPLYERLVQD